LLYILSFWDPERIEFETIKTGTLSLRSPLEPTKQHSKSKQNRHWKQWLALSLNKIPYFGFAFSNKNPASNLKTEINASLSCELESLIKLTSSEVQLHSALQQIQMRSLIKRRSTHEGGAHYMHGLIQSCVQVALESEGTYLQWFRYAVRIACGVFRQIGNPALPEIWHQYEGMISHIVSLTQYSELVDPKNADLLTARAKIAAYWCNRGRFYEARETYRQILGIGSNERYDAGIETTQWKLGLAEVNWHLGKFSESILLYDEVRQIRESQLGADHPDALHIVERVALVYRSQARFAEARSMLEHVLESRKMSLGPDHLDTIRAIDNLAMTINDYAAENAEAYGEAEKLHMQALAHREAQLGTDHLDTLWSADNLATNYRAQGRHLEAVEIYKRVLEGRKLQLGEDHPQTNYTLANIASAYTSLGRLNEAEVMWKRLIVSNEKQRGHSHSQTLFAIEGLADVYLRQSRFENAISLYNRALRGNEESLGCGHPSVMRKMHKLANLYLDQNDFIKSIALFERLLEGRKNRLRFGHPDMLRTYHDAATSYIRMGKYIEAEQCYRLELAGSIEELGSLHSETKKRELNLANFLRDQVA
jgi:tetratricopeptide (TPR) repeat protein